MLTAKTCFSLGRQELMRNSGTRQVLRQCLILEQKRSQTNAAASPQPDPEWEQARPFSEIPTMSGLAMIRNSLPGGKYAKLDAISALTQMLQDEGGLFVLPPMLGRPALLMTSNPVDFEQVFRNEGVWPTRPGSYVLEYYRREYRADFFQGVEGIITTQGEKWGKFRSAVNPVLMQPKNVKLYAQRMSAVNQEFIKRIHEIRDPQSLEVPDNFENEINRWALESVSVVALDRQLGLIAENRDNSDANLLFNYITDFMTLSPELDFMGFLWRYVPTPKFKRLMKALDGLLDVTMKYINEAVTRLEAEQQRGIERPENEKSVLEKLLKLDKRIAIVMAMDMLMAGVDTTSSTLTAMLLCLAKNPDKQEKLRDEIRRILPHKDSEFTEASLNNMPYLRACRKEAMRVYPLVIGTGRAPARDVVLSGYQVPKDTQVMMHASDLYKNEKYFPRPDEFIPERWLRASKDSPEKEEMVGKLTNPFVYLPFGFGSRMCIGKRIAELELDLGTARLIRNFKVEFNHPTENAFKTLLINVPNIPLKFKFTDVD